MVNMHALSFLITIKTVLCRISSVKYSANTQCTRAIRIKSTENQATGHDLHWRLSEKEWSWHSKLMMNQRKINEINGTVSQRTRRHLLNIYLLCLSWFHLAWYLHPSWYYCLHFLQFVLLGLAAENKCIHTDSSFRRSSHFFVALQCYLI